MAKGKATTTVNLRDFDADLHRKMRMRALEEKMTVKELYEKSAKEYLDKVGKAKRS